jgi:3-hydroxyisobutyrate dehydrogenase-like beta-hydroxyacid dehydrogenase
MAEFLVGPGIQAALEANDDSARSDEIFVLLTPGEKVSQVFGTKGIYYWMEHDNVVVRSAF